MLILFPAVTNRSYFFHETARYTASYIITAQRECDDVIRKHELFVGEDITKDAGVTRGWH